MNRPLGVLFDFGDTILKILSIDTLAGNRKLLEFAENASHLTAEDIQLAADEIWVEVDRIREESQVEFGGTNLNRLLFETLGVSFKVDYLVLEKEWWNAALRYKPGDGILEVLDALEKYNIKKGIISNSSFPGAVLEQELAKHNLAHRFSFLIASADYGFRKPHPRIFQSAVRMMNLKPQDIWFVGDKLEHDIKGALNSGLYPVWYNCRNEPGKTNYEYLEVKDWYEFKDRIERLFSLQTNSNGGGGKT